MSCVEHTGDQSTAWRHSCFANTEEESNNYKARKVLTSGMAHQNSTPKKATNKDCQQVDMKMQFHRAYTVIDKYLAMGSRTSKYEAGQVQTKDPK